MQEKRETFGIIPLPSEKILVKEFEHAASGFKRRGNR